MLKLGLLLWALFFMLLAFSMMPGYMTFVVIISAIGGVLDATMKNKKRRNSRPDFKLDTWERYF